MAIKKITELAAANSVANSDLLVTVTSPSGSAATKKITVQNFFGNISTTVVVNNTATVSSLTTTSGTVQANLTINGTLISNNLIVTTTTTPANSTSTTITIGSIFYDSNYLYIATANNVVKRALLSTF